MFPNFLGIGAQKSGTTWLYTMLKQHPEIWLPPTKEAHFFNYYLYSPSPFHRKFFWRVWRRQLWERMRGYPFHGNYASLKWDIRYFFMPHTTKWYASIFEPGKGKMTGEITPAYSILDKDQIAYIYNLMPQLKVIFLMRDPIDRAWSQLKMLNVNIKGYVNFKSQKQLIRKLGYRGMKLRGNYLRILENWKSFYQEDQIFIGFFEELSKCPEDLLIRLYRFLEVDTSKKYIPDNVRQRRNPGSDIPLPPRIAYYLAESYYEEIKELCKLFGGYANDWLEHAEKILKCSSGKNFGK